MHFWIDKRSQCGYSGRRVPSSLSAGVGRTRRDRHLKPMVTPVHRFQSVECVAGSARRPPGALLPRTPAPPTTHRTQQHTPTFNIVITSNGVHPITTGRGTVEPDTSVFLESGRTPRCVPPRPLRAPPPIMPAHLKCGMWASFALATIFVAGAKFYFDHQILYEQGTGMEVLIFCGLLVVFLLGLCTFSLCRARAEPPMLPAALPPTQDPDPPSQDSNEDLALGTMLSLQVAPLAGPPQPEPPPPPYHVAVLLPRTPAEQPPPSYEKAVS